MSCREVLSAADGAAPYKCYDVHGRVHGAGPRNAPGYVTRPGRCHAARFCRRRTGPRPTNATTFMGEFMARGRVMRPVMSRGPADVMPRGFVGGERGRAL